MKITEVKKNVCHMIYFWQKLFWEYICLSTIIWYLKNVKEYKQYELPTEARDMDEGQRGKNGKSQAK